MSRVKAPVWIAGAFAAGLGYYFYSAGGDSKAAQKKFEADAHRASASVKDHLPGRGTDIQKEMAGTGARIGSKIDDALGRASEEANRAKKSVESYGDDVKREAAHGAQKVEEGAKQAKGWFGGSSSSSK